MRALLRRAPCTWLESSRPATRDGIVLLLEDLRGRTPIVQLADKTGFSRHRIARWLSGATEPKLQEWLALVEASSLRLLDFVAAFFDPASLPSVAKEWQRLQAVRHSAYARPESHVVLRRSSSQTTRAPNDTTTSSSRVESVSSAREVADCTRLLEAAGQIRWQDEKWIPGRRRRRRHAARRAQGTRAEGALAQARGGARRARRGRHLRLQPVYDLQARPRRRQKRFTCATTASSRNSSRVRSPTSTWRSSQRNCSASIAADPGSRRAPSSPIRHPPGGLSRQLPGLSRIPVSAAAVMPFTASPEA